MKVLIAGDFSPRYRVQPLFDKDDYSSVLSEAKYVIKQSDYSIVNFECPVAIKNSKPLGTKVQTLKPI